MTIYEKSGFQSNLLEETSSASQEAKLEFVIVLNDEKSKNSYAGPFWNIPPVSTLPNLTNTLFALSQEPLSTSPKPDSGKLTSCHFSLAVNSPEPPHERSWGRWKVSFDCLVFADSCSPPWHSAINLCGNEGGTPTETPATFEGNQLSGLLPQRSAMTECDNFTFAFLIQPLSLRNFSLWLLMSPGSWGKKKNQVTLYVQQKFMLRCSSLHRDASGSLKILSPLTCKGCTATPLSATFLSANELFSIPAPHFWAVLPVPSWDCQHYYNLWSCTAIGLKQFPCTFIQAETQARGPKVAGSCITLIQLPPS